MSTGYLVGGRCYSLSSDAVDVYFSSQPPTLTPGATSYVTYYTKPAATWNVSTYSISSAGSYVQLYSTAAVQPAFATCTPEQPFLDGMTVGWGIVVAMVGVWAVVQMRKQAR